MNNFVTCRPYRSNSRILPIVISLDLFAFVCTGLCFPYLGFKALAWALMGLVCFWLTKLLYDMSKITICFEQEGLRIIGDRHDNHRFVHWEELSYAYYTRNFKGHLLLLLSPNLLTTKEAKRLANRGLNSSCVYINNSVVFALSFLENESQIRDLIEDHVSRVFAD